MPVLFTCNQCCAPRNMRAPNALEREFGIFYVRERCNLNVVEIILTLVDVGKKLIFIWIYWTVSALLLPYAYVTWTQLTIESFPCVPRVYCSTKHDTITYWQCHIIIIASDRIIIIHDNTMGMAWLYHYSATEINNHFQLMISILKT